jgi:hypothetical protein
MLQAMCENSKYQIQNVVLRETFISLQSKPAQILS